MKQDYIENNILITSKQTMDIFLKKEKPGDLIALYMFYYYTAKWQGTNQTKSVTSYTAKGLKWTTVRVREAKKTLKELGLIEDVRVSSKKSGQVEGWYIKINYIWKSKSHPTLLRQGGDYDRVANRTTNALSAGSLNALSANTSTGSTTEASGLKKIQVTPETTLLLNQFRTLYTDNFSKPYVPSYAKDMTCLKRLLSCGLTFETITKAMKCYFNDRDKWIVNKGHTIGVFTTHINQYIASANKPDHLSLEIRS